MKKINLLVILVSIIFAFSSCSENETLSTKEASLELLKTYTIKRDANGSYSLDFNVTEGSEVQKVIDVEANMSQFQIYSSGNKSARKISEGLSIDKTQFKVGFIDTNSNKTPSNITIIDDNIVFVKKTDINKLKEYSITSNTDGSYNLDFNVNNNVRVDFVFNEDSKTYEVHLEKGNASKKEFKRVLEKTDGEPLKFVFVNHLENNAARTDNNRESYIRKPQGIII